MYWEHLFNVKWVILKHIYPLQWIQNLTNLTFKKVTNVTENQITNMMVSMTYLRGLEISELKESDMPII